MQKKKSDESSSMKKPREVSMSSLVVWAPCGGLMQYCGPKDHRQTILDHINICTHLNNPEVLNVVCLLDLFYIFPPEVQGGHHI